jgi:hypothetical protein
VKKAQVRNQFCSAHHLSSEERRSMSTTIEDRFGQGQSIAAAVKMPCRGVSTTAITLSGEQTLNSIALLDGDRWLYAPAGGGVDSGIWIVSTGAWSRAKDYNGARDVVCGTICLVAPGTLAEQFWVVKTTGQISPGTTSVLIERHSPDDSAAFAGLLASKVAADEGPALVGNDPSLDYPDQTVGGALRRHLALSQFSGADQSGVADSTGAINVALSASVVLRVPLQVDGWFRHTSQLVMPARISLRGSGLTSDESTGGRSFSCFIKDFNGVGVLFSGDDASTDGVQYDSVTGRTGDVVQVTGSRWRAPSIVVSNAGQDGLRIGKTDAGASSINANLFYIGRIAALKCGRHGVNIDDTNTTTAANYPLGVPNANGGYIGHLETDRNTSDGLRLGNCIDNFIGYLVAQTNAGYGCRFDPQARNNVIAKSYTESNTAGEGIVVVGATQNMVLAASRGVTLSSGWVNSGGNSNLIVEHTQGIGQDTAFNSCPWTSGPEIYGKNLAASGQVFLGGYVDTGSLPAWWRIEKSATSGTKMTLVTKRDGDTPIDRLTADHQGQISTPSTTFLNFGRNVQDTTTPGIQVGSGGVQRMDLVNTGSGSDLRVAIYNGTGYCGGISSNGANATVYATTSDYRLKSDVASADWRKATAAVLSWPMVDFAWTSSGSRATGALAHELQAVLPSAVAGEKDAEEVRVVEDQDGAKTTIVVPQYQGVDWSMAVPELIVTVQALVRRVAELEGK